MHWIKPDWPAPDNIHTAVTLRTGGFSHGKYSCLNLAGHVNDNPAMVEKNRRAIMTMLDLPSSPVWLEQVHSNKVIKIDHNSKPGIQADASYSEQKNVVCSILTADCLPILLCSSKGEEIAAIHAGWRGLLAGIINQTVKVFKQSELIAWLGPAIGSDCFEVGAEVHKAFINKSFQFETAFKAVENNKFLANIYQLAQIELSALGITQIYGGNFCTVTDEQRFYSYRRDGDTGRMATLIWRD